MKIDRTDLIKEVSVFAEPQRCVAGRRWCDWPATWISFRKSLKSLKAPGRKLDFLTQEMGREANTIGSKASDVEISRRVVEIKSTLEKIRELVQNIE